MVRTRILADVESRALEPRTEMLVRQVLYNGRISAEVIEVALIQAITLSRLNHVRIDSVTFMQLVERIMEFDGQRVSEDSTSLDDYCFKFC